MLQVLQCALQAPPILLLESRQVVKAMRRQHRLLQSQGCLEGFNSEWEGHLHGTLWHLVALTALLPFGYATYRTCLQGFKDCCDDM